MYPKIAEAALHTKFRLKPASRGIDDAAALDLLTRNAGNLARILLAP